jgi:hypothetical protein
VAVVFVTALTVPTDTLIDTLTSALTSALTDVLGHERGGAGRAITAAAAAAERLFHDLLKKAA